MADFSIGLLVGTAVGAGIIMAVNPMDKRTRRRMCRKANKMMHRINHSIHNFG